MNTYDAKIIREIAQSLDCGEDCYLHKKTQEIITIPSDFELMEEEFQEIFEPFVTKVEKNKKDFIKFEVLESPESYKIMDKFAYQLADIEFGAKLTNILNARKPFQNFKLAIDHSEYRESWFAFKQKAIEKIVTSILEVSEK